MKPIVLFEKITLKSVSNKNILIEEVQPADKLDSAEVSKVNEWPFYSFILYKIILCFHLQTQMKLILAPMVRGSYMPARQLFLENGADLCYTEAIVASNIL